MACIAAMVFRRVHDKVQITDSVNKFAFTGVF